MVKLDVSLLRFMEGEDFRVLSALEMAMRNHDVAPTALIERIAQLQHGGARKRLNELLRHKMIHHETSMYDGYAMKYAAYDYLALKVFCNRGSITGVGARIGCGKESDIFLVQDEHGRNCVLKLQRLGRCSFRTVTKNRDYKDGKKRHGASWFYLSRLAATKEFAFMKMLYDEGFPVPKPIDHNRHAVVMEHVDGHTLNSVLVMESCTPQKVYERCLNILVKLAEHGLIHGDFNEFNLMVSDRGEVTLIDFPQMVSTQHRNAAELFQRDVDNLATFFIRRFRIEKAYYPTLEKDITRVADLDKVVSASGHFSKNQQAMFEQLAQQNESAERDVESDEEEERKQPVAAPSASKDTDAAQSKAEPAEGAASPKHADPSASPPEKAQDASKEGEGDKPLPRSKKTAVHSKATTMTLDDIRNRLKGRVARDDDVNFARNLHRNMQKGRGKRKIGAQLKSVKEQYDLGLWD